tara:strand:+ start:190 stop:891 length:702 start_codon:yes stop_codon:yes gene_type:complete
MDTIVYGPDTVDTFEAALSICGNNKDYLQKIIINVNDINYYFKITDVHIEIDFELLGTNEYNVWSAFYNTILTITNTKKYFIVCKNFEQIKNELLEVFHIYMRNPNMIFILCTKVVSCLTDDIKNKCEIKVIKNKSQQPLINYEHLIQPVVDIIVEHDIDYLKIRDKLYAVLIYNMDIHLFFREVIIRLYELQYITQIDDSLLEIIRKYNNNYRSIYHLESFVYYFMQLKTTS